MLAKTVLVIGTVWVEPNSSAAGCRMLQLLLFFKKNKYNITFACAAQKSENALDLSTLDIDEADVQINSVSFNNFLNELNPTIVLFDRFITEEQFGWRVEENCPNALRILDTEDLHFLRKVRHKQYKKGENFSNQALLKAVDTKREIASILRCDLSLIISTYEIDLLKSVFKIDEDLLYHLPFLLDKIDEEKKRKWNLFEDRKDFIFIGNFHHKPNVDAVLTLKKYIWKHIKKNLPKAELHIYGAYINQQVKQLHNDKEGFLIKGFTENSSVVISKAKVLLAPLNFGAGIKGKLTDAMQCGTPSITTSIGAEGMHNNLPWSGFIEDDYLTFAQKSVDLYSNKTLWISAQKKGINIINQFYDKDILSIDFLKEIDYLLDNLEPHRAKNFLGSLLYYKTLQANKYMSKWIEEKNK